MKNIAVIGLLMLSVAWVHGQIGVNFQGGVGTLITSDTEFTRSGAAHYGWRAAVFARMGNNDAWHFQPGLSYERYNLVTSEEFNAFDSKEPQLHFLKTYINVAFFLIHNKGFKMRLSGGGNITYLAKLEENDHNIHIDKFNDVTFGINGILGLDFWLISLDLGYENSLTDFFYKVDRSTSRFWTLSLGVTI